MTVIAAVIHEGTITMTNPLHVYIHDLCELMGLRDWEIILKDDPAGDGDCGEVEVMYGQRRAYMKLSTEFASYSPEKQRDTIVHELLHCHVHNVWDSYQRLEEHLASPIFRLGNAMIVRDTEYAVDAIAGAWSRLLPLPPSECEEVAG